jgi:hypothetical protein
LGKARAAWAADEVGTRVSRVVETTMLVDMHATRIEYIQHAREARNTKMRGWSKGALYLTLPVIS